MSTEAFLKKAHVGYQKLMHLKWKYAHQVEQIGFSPCPSIDLIWHTHLLHPVLYNSDMKKILGIVPKHKLIEKAERTKVFMEKREDEQMDLWQKEFEESIFEYAVVWTESELAQYFEVF